MSQTFTDFEVLIIDDGNEPGYEYLKETYEKADSRIKFVRQEHSGVSCARNLGLETAKGEYISFVDSDDYVDPSFLAEFYEAIQDSDVAICAVSEQYFPVHPVWTDRHVFWSKPSFYNGLQYINFCHNKLFKASIIKENNITFKAGMKLGEDAIFIADYLEKCKSFRMVREPRYHYVPDEKSAMHRYREEFWEWEEKVVSRQWELFHQYPLSTFEEQAMERWLYYKIGFAINYYLEREKDRKKAISIIKQICSSELYKRMLQSDLSKNHKHLTKKEITKLRVWKRYGVLGIRAVDFAKKLRWRLHL